MAMVVSRNRSASSFGPENLPNLPARFTNCPKLNLQVSWFVPWCSFNGTPAQNRPMDDLEQKLERLIADAAECDASPLSTA
jgi:hypothetical protein